MSYSNPCWMTQEWDQIYLKLYSGTTQWQSSTTWEKEDYPFHHNSGMTTDDPFAHSTFSASMHKTPSKPIWFWIYGNEISKHLNAHISEIMRWRWSTKRRSSYTVNMISRSLFTNNFATYYLQSFECKMIKSLMTYLGMSVSFSAGRDYFGIMVTKIQESWEKSPILGAKVLIDQVKEPTVF